MRTVTALYDTYDHAAAAVRAVRDAGISSPDISVVANAAGTDDTDVEGGTAAGAGFGAVAGGGAGLLAGLGTLAIPGIGPVIAGGWLLTTAVGALAGAAIGGAAGGLLGALANAGVPEEQAHVYAEGIRRGGTLVSVRLDDSRADSINAILQHSAGIDIDRRRADYFAEGWSGFDESAPPYSDEQIRNYRSSYGVVPPIV